MRLGATKELQSHPFVSTIARKYRERRSVVLILARKSHENRTKNPTGPVLNFETVVTRTCLENDRDFAFLQTVNLGRRRLVTRVERDAISAYFPITQNEIL